MVGVFACPECGHELELEGVAPGREIRCEACSTRVEVPFFPRASSPRRGRRSPWQAARESKALRAALAFAAVVLIGLGVISAIGKRARSDRESVLAQLVASADEAEADGRFDAALIEIEGAVAHARRDDSMASARFDDLIRRRDRLSLLDARARLAAVDRLDPDRAVGESLTLAEKAKTDPALGPLADAIAAGLDGSRRRQAEADLSAARLAFEQGRPSEAFAAAERLHGRTCHLPEPDSRRFREAAESLLEAVVARHGVAIGPPAGRFVAGSPGAFRAMMDRLWSDSLLPRGYLPQPLESPWRSLWDEKAPARATARVIETQEAPYLQSRNRTTQIDATFELTRPGQPPWSNRVVAQTRVPLPNLPAYVAGHLATASRRDPDAERRLYDDAKALFIEQTARALRGIPARSP